MRVTVTPEQIRSAFEAVKDDPSFDESRGLWERGRPPVEMIQAMCLRPEILRGVRRLRGLRLPGRAARAAGQGAGDHHRVEDATTASSARTRIATSCDIADIVRRAAGRDRAPESLAPRERLAVEYTRAAMADSNHIPEPLARRAAGALQRPGARRADVPDRLHQHAQPVQQLPAGPLQRRVPACCGLRRLTAIDSSRGRSSDAVTGPKGSPARLLPMETADRRQPFDRTKAVRRLSSLTRMTAVAGAIGTVAFGGLAAVTYNGVAASDLASDATTSTTTTAAATSTTSQSSTSQGQETLSQGSTTIESGTSGSGQVSTGGSG